MTDEAAELLVKKIEEFIDAKTAAARRDSDCAEALRVFDTRDDLLAAFKALRVNVVVL